MPSIPSANLYQAPLLSRLATKYRNRKFVGEQVFLPVEVPFNKGVYQVWDDVPAFNEHDTNYGPDGAVNIMYTAPVKEDFTTAYQAQGAMIDPDEEQQAPGINVDLIKTEALNDVMRLKLELELMRMLTNSANIPANQTLSGTSQFSDYTNSQPDTYVDGVVQLLYVERSELSILMGRPVFDKVARHPRALDAIKYTQLAAMTPELMARWLGIKEVIVGSAVYNTAKRGQAKSIASIWNKSMLIFYKPDKEPTPLMDQPAFGYLPRRGSSAAGDLWRVYRGIPNPMVGTGEGQRGIKEETNHVPLLTAPALAYLTLACVA